MSTKNRIVLIWAAAAVCLAFAANTPAWADVYSFAEGRWVGSWRNSRGGSSRSSVIDFDQCRWYDINERGEISGELEIENLQRLTDSGGQPYVSWISDVQIGEVTYHYDATARYDEIAGILTIEYQVYDFNNLSLAIRTGTGNYRRP